MRVAALLLCLACGDAQIMRRLQSRKLYTLVMEPGCAPLLHARDTRHHSNHNRYKEYIQMTALPGESIAVAIIPCYGRFDVWARKALNPLACIPLRQHV
jgi:hypothetical protein